MKPHRQLIGLLWLALLTALAIGGVALYAHLSGRHAARVAAMAEGKRQEDSLAHVLMEQVLARERQRAEWDSLREVRAQRKAEYEKKRAEWDRQKAERDSIRYAREHIELVMQPFDPNTADSVVLVHLGLRPWMARSVLHYRAAGGVFRKVEDVRRIYGMTDSLYASLLPYIVLPLQEETAKLRKVDTILSINTADTTELMLLRGVGSFTARQIVRFRDQLGGFYSLEQLREVPYIRDVDSLMPHFSLDTTEIRRIPLNSASIRQLTRHRYISFEQADAILEFRRRKGSIRSEQEIMKTGAFSEEELRKLRPYLDYSKQ